MIGPRPIEDRGTDRSSSRVDDYYLSVSACLGNDLCPGVSIWQFADPTSWIPGVFKGKLFRLVLSPFQIN